MQIFITVFRNLNLLLALYYLIQWDSKVANPLLANNQQTKCRVGETDNKERIIPKIWWRFWKTK